MKPKNYEKQLDIVIITNAYSPMQKPKIAQQTANKTKLSHHKVANITIDDRSRDVVYE